MVWLAALVLSVLIVGWLVFRSGEGDLSPHTTTKPNRLIPTAARQLMIEYINGDGEITERPIILTWIENLDEGKYFLHAYCKLREDNRTFDLDRVQSIWQEGGDVHRKPHEFFAEVYGAQLRDLAVTHKTEG